MPRNTQTSSNIEMGQKLSKCCAKNTAHAEEVYSYELVNNSSETYVADVNNVLHSRTLDDDDADHVQSNGGNVHESHNISLNDKDAPSSGGDGHPAHLFTCDDIELIKASTSADRR